MEVKLYFRMLQRSWWIIGLTALSAVMAALVAAYLATPVYKAPTRYIISPNPASLGGESNVIYSLDTLDKRSVITTYAEILNSPRIYNEAVSSVGIEIPDFEKYSYGAIVLPDTNIIEFSVQGPDRVMVASITNQVGQRAVLYIESLYQVYDMTLLDPASIPASPISPQPARDAGVAGVLGVAIGTALALVRELLRAPMVQFMQQRELDPVSLALSREIFEDKLENVAFASVTDFSLCMVHLEGLNDYIHILPLPTVEVILRHVTQSMKNQLRGNDLVGRWTDVDFAVLLSETSGDGSLNTMGRVRAALSIPIRLDISGEDLELNPKIGIAEYRIGDNADSLLKNTNWALELAKKNGNIYLLRATEPL
jgi:diguanylate cyclase (GGDEF)-like protein